MDPNTSPFDQTSSLDNPHIDKLINSGTTAPNCQPRHTREEDEVAAQIAAEMEAELDLLDDDDDDDENSTKNSNDNDNSSVMSASSHAQRRRGEKKAMKEQAKMKKIEEKKAAAAAAAAAKEKEREEMDPRKMGYIQMAKMGYQELVNAIIRPPRAEYKVWMLHGVILLFPVFV